MSHHTCLRGFKNFICGVTSFLVRLTPLYIYLGTKLHSSASMHMPCSPYIKTPRGFIQMDTFPNLLCFRFVHNA